MVSAAARSGRLMSVLRIDGCCSSCCAGGPPCTFSAGNAASRPPCCGAFVCMRCCARGGTDRKIRSTGSVDTPSTFLAHLEENERRRTKKEPQPSVPPRQGRVEEARLSSISLTRGLDRGVVARAFVWSGEGVVAIAGFPTDEEQRFFLRAGLTLENITTQPKGNKCGLWP